MRTLIGDGDDFVRANLASNSAVPATVLADLANDRCHAVRQAVAANPATPAHILGALVEDVEPNVSATAAGQLVTSRRTARRWSARMGA